MRKNESEWEGERKKKRMERVKKVERENITTLFSSRLSLLLELHFSSQFSSPYSFTFFSVYSLSFFSQFLSYSIFSPSNEIQEKEVWIKCQKRRKIASNKNTKKERSKERKKKVKKERNWENLFLVVDMFMKRTQFLSWWKFFLSFYLSLRDK